MMMINIATMDPMTYIIIMYGIRGAMTGLCMIIYTAHQDVNNNGIENFLITGLYMMIYTADRTMGHIGM